MDDARQGGKGLTMARRSGDFARDRPSAAAARAHHGGHREALALLRPRTLAAARLLIGELAEVVVRLLDRGLHRLHLLGVEALAQRLRGSKDLEIQFSALDALVTLYKRSGRKREARIAETQLARIVEIWSAEMDEEESGDPLGSEPRPAPIETVRREGPKVGRNEPCPCQSGKKYKKCCGA